MPTDYHQLRDGDAAQTAKKLTPAVLSLPAVGQHERNFRASSNFAPILKRARDEMVNQGCLCHHLA
jgi:hypothetical protein